MKKIYSFVFAAIAILSAASCQKELVNAPETDTTNAAPFSFIAEREAETKTVLVEGKSTYWTPGDEISAIDSKGKAQTFIALNAVDMKTPLAENAPAALFYNEMFSIPADGSIHTIYPRKDDVTIDENGVIGILRIGSPQYAVAGSFDPQYAFAYAKAEFDPKNPQTPPTLTYSNIHSLVKFTIGGDKAPAEIVLTNNGSRNIAGQFKYDTMPEDGKSPIIQLDDKEEVLPGAKAITLLPKEGESFEVGKTYYIVVIGGGNFANVTLSFDGEVVKTASDAKYAVAGNNYFLNKIINLGTVQFPAESEKPEIDPADLTATRLWVKTFAELGLSDNGARNCATDGEYVFVPNSAGSPVLVKAFPVNGGEAINVNMTGVEGGTHPTSCVRMIPNSDASINGGKDILLLTNLGISSTIYLYAYTNGIENAPERIPLLNTWRRQGDKFTVVGSWQEGELRFPDWNSGQNAVVRFPIKNGKINTWHNDGNPTDWSPIGKFDVTNGGISEFVTYPGSTSEALVTSTAIGTFNTAVGTTFTQTNWEIDPNLAKTFGYNFFEFNGNKYIAYARLDSGMTNGSLNIIEDKGSAAEFKSSLEVHNKHFTTTVLDTASNTAAGSSVCDCDIVEVDGVIYAAVLLDNCGLAYFKIEAAN